MDLGKKKVFISLRRISDNCLLLKLNIQAHYISYEWATFCLKSSYFPSYEPAFDTQSAMTLMVH